MIVINVNDREAPLFYAVLRTYMKMRASKMLLV